MFSTFYFLFPASIFSFPSSIFNMTTNTSHSKQDYNFYLFTAVYFASFYKCTSLQYYSVIAIFMFQVESLDDPVKPVEAILSRCNKAQVMEKYCVADYNDTMEFLSMFAKRLGKLKKGNVYATFFLVWK